MSMNLIQSRTVSCHPEITTRSTSNLLIDSCFLIVLNAAPMNLFYINIVFIIDNLGKA